jgi:hypothetical protein
MLTKFSTCGEDGLHCAYEFYTHTPPQGPWRQRTLGWDECSAWPSVSIPFAVRETNFFVASAAQETGWESSSLDGGGHPCAPRDELNGSSQPPGCVLFQSSSNDYGAASSPHSHAVSGSGDHRTTFYRNSSSEQPWLPSSRCRTTYTCSSVVPTRVKRAVSPSNTYRGPRLLRSR